MIFGRVQTVESCFDQIADGAGGLIAGTEIPVVRSGAISAQQPCRQHQIAVNQRHHMLPWTHRAGIAQRNRLARRHRTDEIRHDPVGRPVAAANDVAAAGIRNQHAIAALCQRRAIGSRHQLGAGFGGAIGILAAEWILLAIAPDPILIAINLVGGDADDGLDAGREPRGLEHMRGAQRIGGEGLDRIGKGFRNQRLRGQMNDDGRPMSFNGGANGREIADIAEGRANAVGDIGSGKQVRFGCRRKCKPGHVAADQLEPAHEPASGKAGMAGDEDAFALQGPFKIQQRRS